jgi:VanZ family protein
MSQPRRLALAWTLIILVLHVIPRAELEQAPFGRELLDSTWPDKVMHVAMFILFAWLWLRNSPARLRPIAAAGILYGIFLEGLQHWVVPGRSGSVEDLVCDALGLALGAGGSSWVRRRSRRRSEASRSAA